jgi:hypothetical protein
MFWHVIVMEPGLRKLAETGVKQPSKKVKGNIKNEPKQREMLKICAHIK